MCAVGGEHTLSGMSLGVRTSTVTLYVLPLANGHGGLTVQVLQTSVKFSWCHLIRKTNFIYIYIYIRKPNTIVALVHHALAHVVTMYSLIPRLSLPRAHSYWMTFPHEKSCGQPGDFIT